MHENVFVLPHLNSTIILKHVHTFFLFCLSLGAWKETGVVFTLLPIHAKELNPT